MANYKFRFHFPDMDRDRQFCEVETYGGHIGAALNRAWKDLKFKPAYRDIKGLRPTGIEIAPPEKRKR